MSRQALCALALFLLLTACGIPPSTPGSVTPAGSTPAPANPTATTALATRVPATTALPTATSVPPVVDAKALVDNLYKASDPTARNQALLSMFKALNVGVYEARTGKAIQRGAERSSDDFYLYDFEITAFANALARGTLRDTAYLAGFFTRAGAELDGKPVEPAALRPILLEAVRSSAAAPSDPYSLVYLLVRELGLRHAAPYDLLQDVPLDKLQFDAVQAFLIQADVVAPLVHKQAALEKNHGTRLALNLGSGGSLAVSGLQGPCDNTTGQGGGGTMPFGKILGKLWPPAKVIGMILQMIHGEALAYSVQVKALTPSKDSLTTHYAPDDHRSDAGKELRFQIEVRMLDDYGDFLISCGKMVGFTIPKPGGIPDVRVIWDTGKIDKHGTLSYEPPEGKTNKEGIATMVFKPKNEKRPKQGPLVEEKGTVTGVALYQSAFGNLPGSIAQVLAPKSDVISWTVGRHKNLSLEIQLSGEADVADAFHVVAGGTPVTVPLEGDGTSFRGEGSGHFSATVSGECSGVNFMPVSFKVTAEGMDPLNFTVQPSATFAISVSCEEASGSKAGGGSGKPITFSLPATDGASNTMSFGSGAFKMIFTLKEQ